MMLVPGGLLRRVAILVFFLVFILGFFHLFSESPYAPATLRNAYAPLKDAFDRVTSSEVVHDSSDSNPEYVSKAPDYAKAIMDPEDSTFPRLACPRFDERRYEHLRPTISNKLSYFFALDFRDHVALLPRLMGSIVEAIRFLGAEHCALSVVEGNSHDGSYEVLDNLRESIESLGAQYFFQRSYIDPHSNGDRIGDLAELRNLALEPLIQNAAKFSSETTIFFLNDVSICPEDILELAHQKKVLGADMTCGLDWTYVGPDPTFYDVWVARTIHGDSFFNIPEDGNWNSAWNLFWNAPEERARLQAHKPFQVFSCWNGAAVFTADAILRDGIRFRSSSEEECFQGEPQLFCKDLWLAGYSKIAVIPGVNLEYDDEHAAKIKGSKGYVSQMVPEGEMDDSWKIDWRNEPPEKVKCMPSYDKQEWRPWNEGA